MSSSMVSKKCITKHFQMLCPNDKDDLCYTSYLGGAFFMNVTFRVFSLSGSKSLNMRSCSNVNGRIGLDLGGFVPTLIVYLGSILNISFINQLRSVPNVEPHLRQNQCCSRLINQFRSQKLPRFLRKLCWIGTSILLCVNQRHTGFFCIPE